MTEPHDTESLTREEIEMVQTIISNFCVRDEGTKIYRERAEDIYHKLTRMAVSDSTERQPERTVVELGKVCSNGFWKEFWESDVVNCNEQGWIAAAAAVRDAVLAEAEREIDERLVILPDATLELVRQIVRSVLKSPKPEPVESPVVGAIYTHFKGGRYRVDGVVKCSDSVDEYVVYHCLDNAGIRPDICIRPLREWSEYVTTDLGTRTPRFWRQEE